MDQNYNPYENPENNTDHNQNYSTRPNVNPMETMALMLGLFSIITCSCLYLSLPTGSVAIVLALLSRGGNMKLSSKAKLAIVVGIMGIIITIVTFAVSFYIAINEFGSIEGILREYCDMVGLDFEVLYGDMFQ